jgi:thiol-disulfide isomerase/thioredoxin
MLQRFSGVFLVVSAMTWGQPAHAQCATCGNPALTAGASDLGKALGEEVVATPALTLSGSYSFTNFDEFQDADGNRLAPSDPAVGLNDEYFLALHVFVLNAEVSHPLGAALSLAVPYGVAAFHNERGEEGTDPGFADIESRLRLDINKLTGVWSKGSKPRLNVSLGGVAPTGEFVASTDVAGSDRYVSLGRGVAWGLAEFDLRGYLENGAGWYVTGGLRTALQTYVGTNDYEFDWGNEYRLSVGGSAQVIPKKMGLGFGVDWNQRGTSQENGVEFPNGGGQDITLSGTIQGRLPGNLMASVGLRYPVWYEVKGTQVVSDPNVFGGIAYRFGGSKVVKKEGAAALPKPNVLPGEIPKDPELLKVLGENQVTIIDYWAEWCVNCMKLMPYIDAFKKNNPHVKVVKMDATKWEVEEFKRFLPATPELPALDVYGADKRLIIRLGGTDVFKYREHLPAGVDKGYPEGWEPPADKAKDDQDKAKEEAPKEEAPKAADPEAAS